MKANREKFFYKNLRIINLLCISTLLGACANLARDRCIDVDWYTLGFEEGANGLAANPEGERQQSCTALGVQPDLATYQRGYSDGIATFCHYALGLEHGSFGKPKLTVCPVLTEYHQGYAQGQASYCSYESGYQTGLTNRDYNDVCQGDAKQTFQRGYNVGKHIFELRIQLQQLDEQLQLIVTELTKYEDTAKKNGDTLSDRQEKIVTDLKIQQADIQAKMSAIRRELADQRR